MSSKLFAAVVVATTLAIASAECPNACSGHGTCGANDMCTCYRNWQSSDCSERTCPYGWSFTTTPQGDINMDGDRFDSSLMPVVFKSDVSTSGPFAGEPILASVAMLSDQLVFNANIDASELTAGDCVLVHFKSISGGVSTTKPKEFCVKAVSSSSPLTTFTLDSDNDEAAEIADAVVYKMIVDQANPKGTWESWPGVATTKWQDEGHFYMECSNAGACDRTEGTCMCYAGYTGLACARTTCPNDCSNHGVCMNVQELSVKSPNKVALHVAATMGSTWVSTDVSATGVIASGDRVFLGEQASYEESNLYSVGLVTSSGFYVTPPARGSLPFGSSLYSSSSYGLWDATKNQACKCDPGFTGYACDEKVCPHGADPLDSRGEDFNQSTSTDSVASYYTKATETQTLSIDTSCGTASGHFSVVHTDQVTGEKVTSKKVQVMPQLSSTVTVTVPAAVDTKWCPNSGTHKGLTGVDTLPTEDDLDYARHACFKYVTFEPHLPTYELMVGDFIRVGAEYREIGAFVMDGVSGNYSAAYVTTRFTSGYQSGSLAFRNNAANSLKQSLQHLDNGAVTSASVERRAPSQQLQARWNAVNSAADGTIFQFTNHRAEVVNAPLCVGDIVASNNYDDTPSASNVMGAQQYMYQVQKTVTDPAAGPGAAKVQIGGPNSWYKGTTTPSLISQQVDTIASLTPSGDGAATGTIVFDDASANTYVAESLVLCHGIGPIPGANQVFTVTSWTASTKTLVIKNASPTLTGTNSHGAKGYCMPAPAADQTAFRVSGGSYEIQTDVDGDQSELVCDTSAMRAVYVASSGGHVAAALPQRVVFVDHTYGANQPTPKALSVHGGHSKNHPESLSNGDVLYVGEQKCTVIGTDQTGHATNVNDAEQALLSVTHVEGDSAMYVDCAETLDAVHLAAVEIVIGGATTSCTATDMRPLQWQNTGLDSTVANTAEDSTSVNVVLSNNAMRKVEAITAGTAFVDFNDVSIGDRVMLALGGGLYETRTIDSIAADYTSFTVQKAFSSSVITTTAYKMYIVGRGSKAHTECAGRGLCDDAAGECQCFKGYTQAACQEQSALAA